MDAKAIAEQLQKVGYIVLEKPLLKELSSRLSMRCHDHNDHRFHSAQIGRGAGKHQASALRGDAISWLHHANVTDCAYLACMEKLRIGLNEALYLGLFDYESHYAIYAAGAGYARHSDVLRGTRNRIVSTVLYLNADWQANDGGELILFQPIGHAAIAPINPTFGKMVIFLSESFPHEVLATRNTRRSIAGWFRVRETQ